MAGPETIEIPPELMEPGTGAARVSFPAYIYREKRANPWGIYERQLRDYYYQQIEALLKKKGKDIEEEDKDKDRLLEKYVTESKAAETLFNMGAPVNTLPFYDEVRNIYGVNVRAGYRDYAAAENQRITKLKMGAATPEGRRQLSEAVLAGDISEEDAYFNNPYWQNVILESQAAARKQQEAQQKTEQAKIEQLKANVYGQRGRVALQQAVGQGLISPEDAYQNNPYWQDYTQSEYAKGQEGTAAEAEQTRQRIAKMSNTPEGRRQLLIEGLITPEQAYPSEEQTLASKAAGLQAVNPGMSMEEARKVADVSSVDKMAQAQASQVMEPYRRWMAIAKQEGIDTSQYETNLPTGNLVEQIARVVSDTREGRKARQSALLAKQYPEGFRQYTQETGKGFPGSKPTEGWEKGFYGWATAKPEGLPGTEEYRPLSSTQEAFQGSVRAQEEASLKKYGNIYQAYKTGFLGKLTDPNEYKPLEQWLQETPEAKVAWEEQERIRALSGPRPGRPIYARRR